MTDFDAFMRQSLRDAEEIVGQDTFSIEGVPDVTFSGVLNSHAAAAELVPGGAAPRWPAELLCDRDQFTAHFNAPLEQSLARRTVILDGRRLRIDNVELDSISIRLTLGAPGSFR